MKIDTNYSYSYSSHSYGHTLSSIDDVNSDGSIAIPVTVFSKTSTMQAICRYLVDEKGFSFSQAARLLQRSPKSVWASYHQSRIIEYDHDDNVLLIPISIFTSSTAPLESLVLYLKSLGLNNASIARLLNLDPRTTWTVAKRGEAKQ